MTGGVLIPPTTPPARPPPPRRRCVRHEEREAVARCVGCGGGFCRECITEHDGKLRCAPCFARSLEAGKRAAGPRRDWRRLRAGLLTVGALFCLVGGFYGLGRLLAAIPPELHDGTVWKKGFAP